MTDLKESKISSENVYKGSFLDIRKDIVTLPNGNTSTREWIKHPGAACIIPVMSDGNIALIKQYRYPVQSEMIEIPGRETRSRRKTRKVCKKGVGRRNWIYSW